MRGCGVLEFGFFIPVPSFDSESVPAVTEAKEDELPVGVASEVGVGVALVVGASEVGVALESASVPKI